MLGSTVTFIFSLAGRAALKLRDGTVQNADLAVQSAMQAHQQAKAFLDQTYSISAQVGAGLQRTGNLQNPDCLDVWRHFPESPTRVVQTYTMCDYFFKGKLSGYRCGLCLRNGLKSKAGGKVDRFLMLGTKWGLSPLGRPVVKLFLFSPWTNTTQILDTLQTSIPLPGVSIAIPRLASVGLFVFAKAHFPGDDLDDVAIEISLAGCIEASFVADLLQHKLPLAKFIKGRQCFPHPKIGIVNSTFMLQSVDKLRRDWWRADGAVAAFMWQKERGLLEQPGDNQREEL